MKTTINYILALAALLSCTACAPALLKAKTDLSPLPPLASGRKLPLHAALIMDAGITNFVVKPEGEIAQDYSEPLTAYAQQVVDHTFSKFTIFPSESAATGQPVDVILHPKGLKVNSGVDGVSAWANLRTTLVVEWVARDRSDKNTLWLKTFSGTGEQHSGNVFTAGENQRKRFQLLFDDLARQTVQAIENSPELKALAPAAQ